jgi:hypothetical protein
LRIGDGRKVRIDDGDLVSVTHGSQRVKKFRSM